MRVVLPGTYLTLSVHCLEQMLAREISVKDVRAALEHFEQRYTGTSYGELRETRQIADYAVVVAPHRRTLVTVLYRDYEDWDSIDGRPSGAKMNDFDQAQVRRLLHRSRNAVSTHAA